MNNSRAHSLAKATSAGVQPNRDVEGFKAIRFSPFGAVAVRYGIRKRTPNYILYIGFL